VICRIPSRSEHIAIQSFVAVLKVRSVAVTFIASDDDLAIDPNGLYLQYLAAYLRCRPISAYSDVGSVWIEEAVPLTAS